MRRGRAFFVFLGSFMGGWFEVKNVPVFDEHYDPARQGPLQRVDRPLLEEIARNSQRRIDDTGDECPIIIGHTSKERKQQAPVVGFARNFRVETLGRANPRAAIYCDYRFPEAARSELYWGGDLKCPKFPRRSVEVWPTDRIIDPIALLGGETPRRDLGIMTYSRPSSTSEQPVRYSMADDNDLDDLDKADDADLPGDTDDDEGDSDMGFDMADLVKQVMAALAETPAFQYLAKKMQEEQTAGMQAQQAAQAGAPAAPPPAAPPPAAAPGAPPPNGPPQQFSREKERTRMERDEWALKYSRLEQEHSALKARVDASDRKARRAEREQQLAELQHQGYQFSRAEELEDADSMTPEQWTKHLGRIKQRYQRAPIGQRIETPRINDGGDEVSVSFSREDNEAVQDLMRQERVTYAKAKEMYLARTNGAAK